jgi:hypothetical protein
MGNFCEKSKVIVLKVKDTHLLKTIKNEVYSCKSDITSSLYRTVCPKKLEPIPTGLAQLFI